MQNNGNLKDIYETVKYLNNRTGHTINASIEELFDYLPNGDYNGIKYKWDYDTVDECYIYYINNENGFVILKGEDEFKNWIRTKRIDQFLENC